MKEPTKKLRERQWKLSVLKFTNCKVYRTVYLTKRKEFLSYGTVQPITLQVHLHTQRLITFLSKLCSPLFESLQFLFRDGAKRMAHHLLKVSDGHWWRF